MLTVNKRVCRMTLEGRDGDSLRAEWSIVDLNLYPFRILGWPVGLSLRMRFWASPMSHEVVLCMSAIKCPPSNKVPYGPYGCILRFRRTNKSMCIEIMQSYILILLLYYDTVLQNVAICCIQKDFHISSSPAISGWTTWKQPEPHTKSAPKIAGTNKA